MQQMDSNKGSEFTPPRHWVGVEELSVDYWSDPSKIEKRGQEFFDKPIETIEKIDQLDKKGLARREFLTLMGASMAMAGFACARRPVHKIIPYVVKPEEITPGVSTYYSSTCPETGVGLLVKTRDGRPVKLEGNPDDPFNQGALSARSQAALLNLYDPDRLKGAGSRARGSERLENKEFKDVDAEILGKLKAVASGTGRVRVLSHPVMSPSTSELIQSFLSCFPAGKHVAYQPLNDTDVSSGQAVSYGAAVLPRYVFEKADVVLSLGSDFLGSYTGAVEAAAGWAKRRKLKSADVSKATLSKFYCFESGFSVTGANADERIPIRSGDETRLALAIANELIVRQKRSSYLGDSAILSALAPFKPEIVAKEIGIDPAMISRVAQDLWLARGRGIVIAGGPQTQTTDGVALQIAVNLLNSALENEGSTIDGSNCYNRTQGSDAEFSKLIEEMNAGQVDALVVWGTNPAYTCPEVVSGFEKALGRVGLVVRVGTHDDETARYADYVLGEHHFLENWGDSEAKRGVITLQQPVIAPIHATRSFEDTLLTWMKSGVITPKSGAALVSASKDWHGYLKARVGQITPGDSFWETALQKGMISKGVPAPSARRLNVSATVSGLSGVTPASQPGVKLVLYSKVSMGDGRSANNGWLQEMPDPISSITWDNYLNISQKLASQLKVKDDDVVRVTSEGQSAELAVKIQPGLHEDSVSAALGYGRRSGGRVANGCGQDLYGLAPLKNGRRVFAGLPVKLEKTGRHYRLASTQWHFVTENRPIINDITFKEFKKNPAQGNHTDPHLRMDTVPSMWPEHKYPGHKWGMAIDLNSCTGCGACVIACQAENNIPIVGRDQVRVSRQMHWIRIDRYYSGSPEAPRAVFQPMLCQHCDNAPCETVCPVLATVHDNEGMNVQVYNRCVGTRYCQNNCPYKVRRFNFFDHWKAYEGPMNLVWNPDITVRTRGIMEKCTFCLQRVRAAKDTAKDQGRKVKDGDVVTACQQTCPTHAITFGDLNDKQAEVAKMTADPLAFRVLEVTNTRPAISYMTKVRNIEPTEHGHGGHEEKGAHA